jgi:mycothiol synthase
MVHLLMRLADMQSLPPMPELPAGYTLREYKDSDLEALAVTLDLAFDDVEWTPDLLKERLIDASDVVKTFVVEFEGKPVATASARIMEDKFPGSGYLHWVGVHPDHRGKQLGKIVTIAVLEEFVKLGCKDAVLETQDHRLPAIRTYKNLGFEETHVHESHPLRWAMIAELLASANL